MRWRASGRLQSLTDAAQGIEIYCAPTVDDRETWFPTEPNFGGETTHFADLDRRIIARGKYDLDVVGHYARPDIFNLTVDTRPESPVCCTAETLQGTSFSCQPHTIAEATEGSQRC